MKSNLTAIANLSARVRRIDDFTVRGQASYLLDLIAEGRAVRSDSIQLARILSRAGV